MFYTLVEEFLGVHAWIVVRSERDESFFFFYETDLPVSRSECLETYKMSILTILMT